jgi:hypothetical protein
MKTKSSQPNYGVLVLSRPFLRRLQREWEMVETPPPPMSLTPESIQLPEFPVPRTNVHRYAA